MTGKVFFQRLAIRIRRLAVFGEERPDFFRQPAAAVQFHLVRIAARRGNPKTPDIVIGKLGVVDQPNCQGRILRNGRGLGRKKHGLSRHSHLRFDRIRCPADDAFLVQVGLIFDNRIDGCNLIDCSPPQP